MGIDGTYDEGASGSPPFTCSSGRWRRPAEGLERAAKAEPDERDEVAVEAQRGREPGPDDKAAVQPGVR